MSDLKKQFHGLRTLIDHQFELENNLIHKHEELEATATRRLGLLKQINYVIVDKCFIKPDKGYQEKLDEVLCELAEELKDE